MPTSRTTTGFTDDKQEVSDPCKTTVIDLELRKLQMGNVTFQETRLPRSGFGIVKEFFFQQRQLTGNKEQDSMSEKACWDASFYL